MLETFNSNPNKRSFRKKPNQPRHSSQSSIQGQSQQRDHEAERASERRRKSQERDMPARQQVREDRPLYQETKSEDSRPRKSIADRLYDHPTSNPDNEFRTVLVPKQQDRSTPKSLADILFGRSSPNDIPKRPPYTMPGIMDGAYDAVPNTPPRKPDLSERNHLPPRSMQELADVLFGKTPPKPAPKPRSNDPDSGDQGPPTLPIPKPKPPIVSNKVDDTEIILEVIDHEKSKPYMYKDTSVTKAGGHVTVGAGFLIRSAEEAKKYPFTVPDGKGGRRPATDKEIEIAFYKVDSIKQPKGKDTSIKHKAIAFDPNNAKAKGNLTTQYSLDDLQLSEDKIQAILAGKIREHANYAKSKMENDGLVFDSFPPSIQKLLTDLQYSGSLLGGKSRSDISKILKRRDWKALDVPLSKRKIPKKRDEWRLKQIDEAVKWDAQNKPNR